ncbi:hypothetical protein GGX14DRAFT_571113 [Mycena pura]|uniref:Uncharacterized protein n=1 Tax=Mycena pura TaxID=153505 RepID=A0AAD6V468_9AGAR|nr:hypothetical protein GGX14DRAFT_571113 [Mycena pura]
MRYERAGLLQRVHCIGDYFPHSELASSILQHATTADALFFAVLTGQCKGIYSDFSQILKILRTEPEVQYISHKTWEGIVGKWRAFCEREHDHEWRDVSVSRSPSPVFSLSAFDTSSCPSPTDSRRSSLDLPHPDLPALQISGRTPLPAKQPLHPLPSRVRSPPVSPSKPRNASSSPTKQSLSNLKQSGSARSSIRAQVSSAQLATAYSPVKGSSELRFPTPVHTTAPSLPPFPQLAAPVSAPRHISPPQYKEPLRAPSPATSEVDTRPVLYAVSVCNRLLMSKARAFKLFTETEGAVMLLTMSVGEAAVFFERTSEAHTMYAVSGERKAFRDREQAFRLFLQKAGAQMLFASSADAVESFIREHVSL